ncbi:hypothetical protein BST97_02810 [Nonlabens spongiae]|uniref:Uncharacterized protein n=1 Tax=Nonlabens spongiae TaxID=331648 RepID=A0A1W6MHC5_9FLAO|nr:hypothetical protein [Nonlabens spongiae]ARN77014.1 hypothetical protein BST97_02810 [Nonlabens spongiae]
MKSYIYLLLIAFSLFLNAQAPEAMTYQAVVRDSGGAILSNAQVGMEIGIYQNAVTGSPVYTETHTPTTNTAGLLDIQIGTGTAGTGTFSDIDWSTGNYWLETKIDPAGGTTYTITGNSQLLSVPFAFHSNTTSSVASSSSSPSNSGVTTEFLIPYLPYGPTASQIIYITSYYAEPANRDSNAATVSTDISVEAIDNNGNLYDLGVITSISDERVTKLHTLINNALQAAGLTGNQVAIKITASNSNFNLYPHAGFNVGGNDRMRIEVVRLN